MREKAQQGGFASKGKMRPLSRPSEAHAASRIRRREESKALVQRPVPYQKRAASWVEGIHERLVAAEVGRAVRLAVEAWVARQARGAKALDFTAAQLADRGGCSVRSVNREVPRLLASGILVLVEAACHGRRLAAVYRLGEALPCFGAKPAQRTKCPSPPKGLQASPVNPLRLESMNPPCPQEGAHDGLRPGKAAAEGTEAEQRVAEQLRKVGADEPGIRSVVNGIRRQNLVSNEEACREVLKDIKRAMDLLAFEPGWVERPIALVMAAARSRGFGERVKLWLRHARRDHRRRQGPPRPRRTTRGDGAPPWLHLLAGPEFPDADSARRLHAEAKDLAVARLKALERGLSPAGQGAVAREVDEGLRQLASSPVLQERARGSLWAHAVARVAWLEALPGTREARC